MTQQDPNDHENPLIVDESEARRLLVSVPLPKDEPLNDEQREAVLITLSSYMARYGLHHRDVCLNVKDLSATTFSNIINKSYKPKDPKLLDDYLRRINAYMEQDARRREGARSRKPLTTTTVVKLVRTGVDLCIQNATMGYVTGPAGIGKTATLIEIERSHPGVTRIGVNMSNAAMHAMARRICMKLKIGGHTRRKDLRDLSPFERIVATLKGSHRLLVFDDAHKLHLSTLEMLRELHDECAIGILLIGSVNLAAKINRTTSEDRGQLESRFGVKLDVRQNQINLKDGHVKPLYTAEEIRKIFTLPGIRLVGGSVNYLLRLANEFGKGGIRAAEHLVFMAARAVRKRKQLPKNQQACISEENLKDIVSLSDVMTYNDTLYGQCYEESKQPVAASA